MLVKRNSGIRDKWLPIDIPENRPLILFLLVLLCAPWMIMPRIRNKYVKDHLSTVQLMALKSQYHSLDSTYDLRWNQIQSKEGE